MNGWMDDWTNGQQENWVHGFGGETWGKETMFEHEVIFI